ncbi:hypothetical protein ACHAXH_001272 [Discostella pseudostelligera]
MFTAGRVTMPATSLPAGWTAYTDVKTSQTYYVHLPTGDTQWTRPPPPPPPPPHPPQPNLILQSTTSRSLPCSLYTMPASIPHSMQFSTRPLSSGGGTLFNGSGSESNTTRLSYYPNNNQATLPPLPHPTTSFNSSSTSQSQPKRSQPTHHANKPPTKRPRVKPKQSNATHITPESSNSRKWKECSKCKLQREWQFFSKKQWQSGVSGMCKSCVDETVGNAIEQSRAAAKAAKLSPSAQDDCNNITSECIRVQSAPASAKKSNSAKKVSQPSEVDLVKACSECKMRGTKGAFSKRQWSTRVRKCKSCMEKSVVKSNVSAKSKATSGQVTVKDDAEGGDINANQGNRDNTSHAVNVTIAPAEASAVPGEVVIKQEKI